MADLSETIESVAGGPKSAAADGVSVEQHDIDSLIKADKYLAGKTAASKAGWGIRFGRLVSGGPGR